MGASRITQDGVEAFVQPTAASRVTQAGVEPFFTGSPPNRLTQAGVETFITGHPPIRLTQVGVEVWYYIPAVDSALLLKADTGTDDDVELYAASVLTRAIPPAGEVNQLASLRESTLAARATDAEVQLTIHRDFDKQEQVSTVDVNPVGAESRVFRKFDGSALADVSTVQLELGDATPTSDTWSLDKLHTIVDEEGET